MNGYERNRTAKRIAKDVLGYAPSVAIGQGTARSWVTLYLSKAPTDEQRDLIATRCVEAGVCGTWWPDDGTDSMATCIGFCVGSRVV